MARTCSTTAVVSFSNFADQRLYRQEPGGDPVPITPDTGGRDRYADGRITPDGRWLICVRERHPEPDDPSGVVNELVDDPAGRIGGAGRDPFGSRLLRHPAGVARRRPALLGWNGISRGCRGTATSSSSAISRRTGPSGTSARSPAGPARSRSSSPRGVRPATCTSPRTGPAGGTSTASDEGDIRPLHPAEAEFGWPQWVFGMSAYGFLGDGRIACLWERDGAATPGDPRSACPAS